MSNPAPRTRVRPAQELILNVSVLGIDIDEACVCVFDEAVSKQDALDRLVDAVGGSTRITNATALRKAVFEREWVTSTALGNGVAVPHVRIDAVSEPVVGVGLSRQGIDFGAPDSKPVRIIVLFAMPAGANKLYLSLVAEFMLALKTPDFRDRLLACSSPAEVAQVFNESGA